MAKFYNIANYIDERYFENKYVTLNSYLFKDRIKNYIINNEDIKTGDILFVGSNYEKKQVYGFILVDKRFEITWEESEKAVNLVFENEDLKNYLSLNDVKYKVLFTSLNDYFLELSFYKDNKSEVKNKYTLINLWK
jgi:hypothetical protein